MLKAGSAARRVSLRPEAPLVGGAVVALVEGFLHDVDRQHSVASVLAEHFLRVIRRRAEATLGVVADQIRVPLLGPRADVHQQRRVAVHDHEVRVPLHPDHPRR